MTPSRTLYTSSDASTCLIQRLKFHPTHHSRLLPRTKLSEIQNSRKKKGKKAGLAVPSPITRVIAPGGPDNCTPRGAIRLAKKVGPEAISTSRLVSSKETHSSPLIYLFIYKNKFGILSARRPSKVESGARGRLFHFGIFAALRVFTLFSKHN